MIPTYNAPIDKKDIWNPSFYKDFLGFESLVPFWQPYEMQFQRDWPVIEDYNAWFRQKALSSQLHDQYHVLFAPQTADTRYEQDVYHQSLISTRLQNWHDFFNNVTWILYPKTKWAIIQKSYEENVNKPSLKVRSKRQNLLAHFDECAVVLCSDRPELFEDIKAFSWKKFFFETQHLTSHAWPLLFGHGLLEKAIRPYIGMTGKAVFLPVNSDFFTLPINARLALVDEKLSTWILSENFPSEPKSLHPFPLLGWPNWHVDNRDATFYDNRDYFRVKVS
ncbi:MAG: DUF3025 domain-containing protein [Candidatus Berkiella sp.]